MTAPKHMNFTRFSQFQKMRKENPELYKDPNTQMAMHALAAKYGEAFFETPAPQPETTDYSSLTSPPTSDLDKKEKMEALRRALEALENSGTNDGETSNVTQ